MKIKIRGVKVRSTDGESLKKKKKEQGKRNDMDTIRTCATEANAYRVLCS